MKNFLLITTLIVCATLINCGGGSSSDSSDTNTDALAYATFGQTLNDAIPDGLKTGGVAATSISSLTRELIGTCDESYLGCPYLSEDNGADSMAVSILSRLWGLDYQSACTDASFADGTCFSITYAAGVDASTFIKPTMLDTPTECATISSTEGRYVNFGVDPCFFDTIVGQISNIAECETVAGGAVDISAALPWFASWGIPQTVNFSSYNARDNGGIWWTINDGDAGNEQYFLSLDTNYLNAGIKDVANDRFLFLGSGSPAYYTSIGSESGVSIAAYAGTLSAIPAQFEAIQVRVQSPYTYIERMVSNGTHLWYQWFPDDVFPSTPADVAAIKDSPSENRCLEIGESVVTSKYVPLSDCVTSFGKADVADLNLDDNFTLKIIDGETASAIDFSAALTDTTDTACLDEVAE